VVGFKNVVTVVSFVTFTVLGCRMVKVDGFVGCLVALDDILAGIFTVLLDSTM